MLKNKEKGTVPLYQYMNRFRRDHMYTTDANEIGTITPGKKVVMYWCVNQYSTKEMERNR